MTDSKPASRVIDRVREFADFAISQTSYLAGSELSSHWHGEPIISFAIAGAMKVTVAGKMQWCDKGAVLLLPEGVPHANSYPARCLRLQIRMSTRFWKRIAGTERIANRHIIRHPTARQLQTNICSRVWNADPTVEIETATYLADLIDLIVVNKRWKPESVPSRWLLQLRDFLDAHCTEPLGMATLVEIVGRHPVHISREFKTHFGKTITEFVRARRVVRAAQLMALGSHSLASIALECGYFDQSHMTKEFRRHAGVTPSQWRNCKVTGLTAIPFRNP